MKLVVIGAGNRGMTYARWAHENNHEVVAVADLRNDRLESAGKELGIPENHLFSNSDKLFACGKIADVAVIASQDQEHFDHAMRALECGYDLLLEKPISPNPAECIKIEQKANALGRKITVCHVLRYAPFFTKIKQILDSGELGKIVAIKHSENIGNFHMAHSYVRGNWANKETSAPIILAKSCHDLDILLWLTGSHCTRIASFGSLQYFRPENAPKDAAKRCCDCPVAANCRFEATKSYLPVLGTWPADVVCVEQTPEALKAALRVGPYGRCVYFCGNDVCDHMSTIIEFENGVTATFSLTAQTNSFHRMIHIMCEHGEIIGDDEPGTISVNHFSSSKNDTYKSYTIHIRGTEGGHNGGDSALMRDFTSTMLQDCADSRSSISNSIESHLMACAAEQSRISGTVVNISDYKTALANQ